MSLLSELKNNIKKRKKRLGRGNSSGKGTYSGKGMKGQNARSGGKRKPGFEGGQTPFIQRMPKYKGFKSPNKKSFQIINLKSLNIFNDNDTITPKELFEKNIISKLKEPVKLLGNGKLEKKLKIKLHKASKTAINEIKKAKGEFKEILSKKSSTQSEKKQEKKQETPKQPKKKTTKKSKTSQTKKD